MIVWHINLLFPVCLSSNPIGITLSLHFVTLKNMELLFKMVNALITMVVTGAVLRFSNGSAMDFAMLQNRTTFSVYRLIIAATRPRYRT